MDKEQLEREVRKFMELCISEGRNIEGCVLCEAYPGDSETSYILRVIAPWITAEECYDIIDELTGYIWKTMSYEARCKLFSLEISKDKDDIHCRWEGTEIFLKPSEGEDQVPA